MKLSISNIAWDKKYDDEMYDYLYSIGYDGIEIAPTRILDNPYEDLDRIKNWYKNINEKYKLIVSSMQSIWYGRNEKIFKDKNERDELISYTKKAIDFANAINCKNLVFGCPKNRNVDDSISDEIIKIAIDFFNKISDYASDKNTYIALEPNPTIYNTNFINNTKDAIDLVKMVDNKGFKLNVDLGTIIYNEEDINELVLNINYINHIHISEPSLVEIKNRNIHKELKEILIKENYDNFISIEMGKVDDIEKIKNIMCYIKDVFK